MAGPTSERDLRSPRQRAEREHGAVPVRRGRQGQEPADAPCRHARAAGRHGRLLRHERQRAHARPWRAGARRHSRLCGSAAIRWLSRIRLSDRRLRRRLDTRGEVFNGPDPARPGSPSLRRAADAARLQAGAAIRRAHGGDADRRGAVAAGAIRPLGLGMDTRVRFDIPWNAATVEHVTEFRTTGNNGTGQPATVPVNALGIATRAIPTFRVEGIRTDRPPGQARRDRLPDHSSVPGPGDETSAPRPAGDDVLSRRRRRGGKSTGGGRPAAVPRHLRAMPWRGRGAGAKIAQFESAMGVFECTRIVRLDDDTVRPPRAPGPRAGMGGAGVAA